MSPSSSFEFLVRDGPDAGKRIPLPGGAFTIGSSESCAVRFPPNAVRERHAEVHVGSDGSLEIADLTGAGLLWVDGKPTARAPLVSGTELRVGRLALLFVSLEDTVAPDETARRHTPFQLNDDPPSAPLSAFKSSPGRASGPRPQVNAASVAPTAISVSGRFTAGDVVENRYRIIAKIAAGGMGEVFKVEHLELGKQLALKVMLPGLTADAEFVNRFKIEAVAASRIGHPNIVDISDFGKTADGRFFFVMEFLDGLTLSSLVHRQGPQPPPRVAELGLQIARALAAAHELHIVHRDLKPDNVMVLQRPGNPDLAKVLDFGVARVHVDSESIGKTAAGIVVGTPQYMSPEQAKAIVVDARSDIYSLGLILHELLTGKPTFTGETAPIVMVKQVTEAPAPLPPFVPDELSDLILRMLEKNPVDRPQQMKEVVESLNRVSGLVKSLAPTDPSRTVPTPLRGSGKRPVATPLRGAQPARAPTPVRTSPTKDREVNVMKVARATAPEVNASETSGEVEAPRGTNPLLIGVLLGLLLVVLGGAALLFSNRQVDPPLVVDVVDPPPVEPVVTPKPPVVPEASSEVVVRVVSTPEGVEVFENGVMLGNTPLPLKRKPNSILDLTLSLTGYQTAQRKLMVSPDSAVVSVTLEKVKTGTRPRQPQGAPPKLDIKTLPPDLDIKPVPF